MNFIKRIYILVALAAFAVTAAAQTHTYETVVAANTCTIAATAGTNVAKVIDCRKQASTIPIQIELMADASGAYTVTVPFQRSLDGVVYAAMDALNIAISFNGVTKQTVVTNVPTLGALYLKIPHLTNHTASISVTNCVIKRGILVGGGY